MMDFQYSPEHEDFRAVLRHFLERVAPLTNQPMVVSSPTGDDPTLWEQAARSLGLQGLEVPEEFGGSEADPLTVAVAMTELGRAMVPGALAPCVGLTVPLLMVLPESPQRTALLAGVAEGTLVPGVATELFQAEPIDPSITLAGTDSAWTITGTARRVVSGGVATDLLLLAQAGDELAVVHVGPDSPGLERVDLDILDAARREAEIRLTNTPVTVLASGPDAVGAMRVAHRRGLLFAACEAVGGAERALNVAVQYAKDREAFGKVIGSFQALKHRMATQYVEIELARTAVMYAAWSMVATKDDEVDKTALEQAKLLACETYMDTARVAIGILGGIGYTWEHPMHLFFKRATALRHEFASPERLRTQIAKATIAEHLGASDVTALVSGGAV